jgi:Trypsin-like peptidase domain
MTKLSLALLHCFFMLSVIGNLPHASALDRSEIKLINQESVVLIKVIVRYKEADNSPVKVKELEGTGMVVGSEGYVLTALHILEPQLPSIQEIKLEGYIRDRYAEASKRPLEQVGKNPGRDLALLKFKSNGADFRAVKFGEPKGTKDGHSLVSLGFPDGLNLNTKGGFLNSKDGPNDTWISDVALDFGDSGAPVFDSDGLVVAIALGGTTAHPNLNLVQKITFAKTMLSDVGIEMLKNGQSVTSKEIKITSDTEFSELPFAMRDSVGSNLSNDEMQGELRKRGSLTISKAALIIGQAGQPKNVHLSVHTLTLEAGGQIVTNGSTLTITAKRIVVSEGSITSFLPNLIVAAPGTTGASGGRVLLRQIDDFMGTLSVYLPGQAGGQGATGSPGTRGAQGASGNSGSDSLFDCKRGPGDGLPGQTGGRGSDGQQGFSGGNGGDLVLVGTSPQAINRIVFIAKGGQGGPGGLGGIGGPGGAGGQSGRETVFCRGGRAGPDGPQGPTGAVGPRGQNGTDGKVEAQVPK